MDKTLLLRHIVYPRTKSIQDNSYEKTVYYTCDKEDVPDFKGIKQIFENDTLVLNIFDTIEKNLDDFLPCKFDGFRIEKNGFNLYSFINKSIPQSGRTALIQNTNKLI